MSLAGPQPLSPNPLRRAGVDLRAERSASVPFPPGFTAFSPRRTRQILTDPLTLLLCAYERHGPVFTLRLGPGLHVFMLGPAANHHMLVSHAANFRWRDGALRDLIGLLGDGLLTIDGAFHRRSRRIVLPAFHRERIEAAVGVMDAEAARALDAWAPGSQVDVARWARELALRVAMRALFGLDPDARRGDLDAAGEFERALAFYGRDFLVQSLRGPGTPWAAMRRARARLDALIFAEIDRRRATGERGEDILSMLLDATDEDGGRLSNTHVRDEVMTLLFAGHDTTAATVTFLLHELARHPDVADRLAGAGPGSPLLDQALDETLRLYPPAWIGPRRSVEPFAFAGRTVPGGVSVNYCSYASHRLPDVWEAPGEFRPERFAPAARAALPKGAYVPFGGGSRTCVGMRFAQAEVKVVIGALLARFRLAHARPADAAGLRLRQAPTLGPRDGLPMVVRAA